ncbi:short-chain dehydrogenase/reductase 3-like [Saccostrea cucullata]|uniref:short-chain dehydrogenase/reductase 3-like n=1 Tax=Saccostrea cuccullata TaxID=36930 RepID=UPI002ED2BF0D
MESFFAFVEFVKLIIRVIFLTIRSCFIGLFSTRKKDISDDIVLITGGGRGIGRALALEFAKYTPKHIILWGRTEETLKNTALVVRNMGVKCFYMVCDVSQSQDIYKNYADIKKMIGPVTILVNNAGIVHAKQIIDNSDEDVKETFGVNTLAHFWTIKAVLPDMIESNRGHLVSISSVLGLLGMRGVGDYCSSKFANTGFMEALQWEIQEYDNIYITSVHPYLVDNQMFAGLKLRFPWLVPPLNESYVASQTVSAVLYNQKCVVMPRIMLIVLWTKSLLPIDAMLPILKFTGVDKAMIDSPTAPKNVEFMRKTVSNQ